MDAEQPFVPKVKGIALPDGKIKPAPLEDMYPLIPIDALQKALLVRCTKSSADAIRCDLGARKAIFILYERSRTCASTLHVPSYFRKYFRNEVLRTSESTFVRKLYGSNTRLTVLFPVRATHKLS